jgi:hypothetical protein
MTVTCEACKRKQRKLKGKQFCDCGHVIGTEPQARTERDRGLGDTIKRVTDFLHIPQCGGCKQRQELLNQIVPYGDTTNGQ